MPQTRPVDAGNDVAAIREAMKLTQIWSWVPTFLPPDEVAFGTDVPAREFLAAASHYARSAHALVPAVHEKLGEVALVQLRLNFPPAKEAEAELRAAGNPVFGEIDKSDVRVHGDEAEIHDVGSKDGALKARRLDGRWKIAMSAEDLRGFDLHETTRFYEQYARLNERLAVDVAAGRFKSADEAAQAKAAAERAIQAPAPPATQAAHRLPPAPHRPGVVELPAQASSGAYVSRTIKVRLDRPKGWNVTDPDPAPDASGDAGFYFDGPPVDFAEHIAPTLNVMRYKALPHETSLEKVKDERLPAPADWLGQPVKDATRVLVGLERITLGGEPGYLAFERTVEGEPGYSAEAFALHQGNIYWISLNCTDGYYPEYDKTLRAILASFRFE